MESSASDTESSEQISSTSLSSESVQSNEILFLGYLRDAKRMFKEKWDASANLNMNTESPENFDHIRTIGKGYYGRVLLVQHKTTKEYHAMKILEKKLVVKRKQVKHTLSEKRILQAVDFPFIVKLNFHFKDNSYLYMGLEYVPGGVLFTHLREYGRFRERQAIFFAAQVVLAFEYLHFLGIIYRDLKPENIILDLQGYIKLADFGFAKRVKELTWTFCGTPDYIAPEVILNKGYSKAVDWWALGVLIYEMRVGHPPFSADTTVQLYENIVSGIVKYPEYLSFHLKDLLKKLLVVDNSARYGTLNNGCSDIRSHKWFQYIDWIDLYQKNIPASITPTIKDPRDTKYFEKYEEEPLKIATTPKFVEEFIKF